MAHECAGEDLGTLDSQIDSTILDGRDRGLREAGPLGQLGVGRSTTRPSPVGRRCRSGREGRGASRFLKSREEGAELRLDERKSERCVW